MTDELLSYYNRELSYVRRLINDFIDEQPDAASRLRVRKDGTDDPHVERLLEGFAYLTARIRRKLDDEFPEISSALLNALYPHYLAPIPSAGVVQFVLDRSQGELTTGYEIPRNSEVSITDAKGTTCTFNTSYQVTLWPVHVTACELLRRPFSAPQVPGSANALSVLHITLTCQSPKLTFDQFDPARFCALRFFLQGQDHHVLPLYELLLNDTRLIALAAAPTDEQPICLAPTQLQGVGCGPDETMLPYGPRSFPGYQLLTEYFAYPFKFLFVDLLGLDAPQLHRCRSELNIYFYFDRVAPQLENAVSPETLRLGCTPIINLFRKRAEPIKLTHTVSRYPVIPDARRRTDLEVYSVDHVSSTSEGGDILEYHPLFAITDGAGHESQRMFWTSTRQAAETTSRTPDKGTEVYLSIVDLDLDPYRPADRTLILETTCLNRDLPGALQRPHAELVQGGPFQAVDLLGGLTSTVRPTAQRRREWALLSHLCLNHLSISNQAADGHEDPLSVAALRRMLELYDFSDTDAAKRKILGITGVGHRRVVGRVSGVGGGFCRGIDVTITFDEDKFPEHGIFLFASVLERFLALYCSINSFSRMTARIQQRDGVLRRWEPRTGHRVLL
jgi:type VI secretion system protein ImpG